MHLPSQTAEGKAKNSRKPEKHSRHYLIKVFRHFLIKKQGYFMKRSKIFLGTTTCLLAIAGAAATKAHYFNTIQAYYITRLFGAPSPHKCVAFPILVPCVRTTAQNANCATALPKPDGGAAFYLLYQTTSGACDKYLKFKSE